MYQVIALHNVIFNNIPVKLGGKKEMMGYLRG